MDHHCSAGNLCLPAKRLELAAQFRGEVLKPGQVAFHRIELAQCLLFALAVLENTRCLFDEPATILRGGVQDRVELSLTHNHVHLAADTRIREQLLDIEQAALLTVDGVLRATVTEQRARDRHLGVLDRQGTVGVVDGQRDFRAAQRRTPGRAGEDDIFHLAAAQALCSLFAHHPGQRIDHIGLARAVRTHHAGDPRFELQ